MSRNINKISKTLFLQIKSRIIELIRIPSSEFNMGSICGLSLEEPVHHVVIERPFFFGKFLVTQEQWQAAMHENPSEFTDNTRLPVESISWDDAKRFCERLSEITGFQVRLPTEAEWEYACRAGTSDEFYFSGKEQDVGEYACPSQIFILY